MTRILLIDDEVAFRRSAAEVLRAVGYQVHEASAPSSPDGPEKEGQVDVLVLGNVPLAESGRTLIRRARERHPRSLIVALSPKASIEGAVQALHQGATDYLPKPLSPEDLRGRIDSLLREVQGSEGHTAGAAVAPGGADPEGIVGTSPAIQDLRRFLRKIAAAESAVLVTGETGTGKELVARAIHAASPRRAKPFVALNCSAIPETLLESQLFGHVRGAFTGADRDREGFFESAGEGTIFLDEIGEMALRVQPKLLRALDAKEVLPLGSTTPLPVRARVVVATNRDLKAMVSSGDFRQDLYFRLSTLEVPIAPLRARPEDIEPTARFLIHRAVRQMNRSVPSLSPGALSALENYHWPGNVRELANVLERALIMSHGPTIEASDLPKNLRSTLLPTAGSLKTATKAFERMFAVRVVDACNGDKVRAAKLLEISLPSLYRKLSFGKSVDPDSD
jgi:DNA-binding NtrC family response regulator